MPAQSTLRAATARTPAHANYRSQSNRRGLKLVSSKEFGILSSSIIGAYNRNTKKHRHRFHAAFGIPPHLVAHVWKDLCRGGFLDHLGPRSLRPIHLLWALLWLKCYNKEGVNASMVGCDEKTFRKWSWFYSECIADLDKKYVSALLFAMLLLGHNSLAC